MGRCPARSSSLNTPCECEEGYSGPDCSECASGYEEVPAPSSWGWGPNGTACAGPIPSLALPVATMAEDPAAMIPVNPDSEKTEGGRDFPWWAILLIALGLLVCVLGIIIAVVWRRKKDQSTSKDLNEARKGSPAKGVGREGGVKGNGNIPHPVSTDAAQSMRATSQEDPDTMNTRGELVSSPEHIAVPLATDAPAAYYSVPPSTASMKTAKSGSDSMLSVTSTPRMPNALGATLPNEPFDTFDNCAHQPSAPPAMAMLRNQPSTEETEEGVKQKYTWVDNDMNAPSESVWSPRTNESLMTSKNGSEPLMSPHDANTDSLNPPAGIMASIDSLLSPKKSGLNIYDSSTLLPEVVALKHAYQTTEGSQALKEAARREGRNQAQGHVPGRNPLSTTCNKVDEGSTDAQSPTDGDSGAVSVGSKPGSPSRCALRTEQRAQARAEKRAGSVSNSSSPTAVRTSGWRKVSTLLMPTVASAARSKISPPKHINSRSMPLNQNPAFEKSAHTSPAVSTGGQQADRLGTTPQFAEQTRQHEVTPTESIASGTEDCSSAHDAMGQTHDNALYNVSSGNFDSKVVIYNNEAAGTGRSVAKEGSNQGVDDVAADFTPGTGDISGVLAAGLLHEGCTQGIAAITDIQSQTLCDESTEETNATANTPDWSSEQLQKSAADASRVSTALLSQDSRGHADVSTDNRIDEGVEEISNDTASRVGIPFMGAEMSILPDNRPRDINEESGAGTPLLSSPAARCREPNPTTPDDPGTPDTGHLHSHGGRTGSTRTLMHTTVSYSEDIDALMNDAVLHNLLADGSSRSIPQYKPDVLPDASQAGSSRSGQPRGVRSYDGDNNVGAPVSVSVHGISAAIGLSDTSNMYVPPGSDDLATPRNGSGSGVTLSNAPSGAPSGVGPDEVDEMLWGRPRSAKQSNPPDLIDATLEQSAGGNLNAGVGSDDNSSDGAISLN